MLPEKNTDLIYNMGFKLSATLNGASVLLLISSTVTPSAISVSVNPVAKSTSKTPLLNVSVGSTQDRYETYQFGDNH